MRAELNTRARIARILNRQTIEWQRTAKEGIGMDLRNKSALVTAGIGLLFLMLSPVAPGGFYPIVFSVGLAITIYGAAKLLRRKV